MGMINLQHFIFTPKYRHQFMQSPAAAAACEKHIRHICDLKDMKIHALAVMPDHVHLFLELPRTVSVAQAAHWAKWYSSIWMRKEYPNLKEHKAFWGHRYFYRSVGGDKRTVEKYIKEQLKND